MARMADQQSSPNLRIAKCYMALRMAAAAGLVISIFPCGAIPHTPDAQAPRAFSATLDPSQASVSFTLAATAHDVHGEFTLKSGNFHLDPATGKISGEIVADARSGRSGNNSRDRRMHQEVLESERFPDIAFRPELVLGTVNAEGKSHVNVQGSLQIHGTQHQITVPLDIDCASAICAVAANFTLPYVEWGMKNPSNFLLRVAKTVEIEFHAKIPIDSSAHDGH